MFIFFWGLVLLSMLTFFSIFWGLLNEWIDLFQIDAYTFLSWALVLLSMFQCFFPINWGNFPIMCKSSPLSPRRAKKDEGVAPERVRTGADPD